MKSYTDLEQSKKLAEILPIESADAHYIRETYDLMGNPVDGKLSETRLGNPKKVNYIIENFESYEITPAWSLSALLDVIKDKCGYFEFVYLKRTYDGRANPLEDVYRLSTDVYDVYKIEAIDACIEMIVKLNEMNII